MSQQSSAVPFVLVGVAMIVGGEPMRRRRVGLNMMYGLRTRATFADKTVWYDANRYAGRLLERDGAVICVAAVVLPRLTEGRWVTEVLAGLTIASAVTSSLMSIRYANRLLAARSAPHEESSRNATG